MAIIDPSTSARNLTPYSPGFESPLSIAPGTLLNGQMLHGHTGVGGGGAAVANCQVKFAAIAFPLTSLTPSGPPSITTVYVVEAINEADGCAVTTFVDAL